MRLTPAQLEHYRTYGFAAVENLFDPEELERLRAHADRDLATESPRRVLEAGSSLVRATHGAHLATAFFGDLVRLSRLIDIAEQVVGEDVYIHQFKINAKSALGGEMWEWHQDSYFWAREDGMHGSGAMNVVVHLDEVTEFNGPLMLIPGSHRVGEIPASDVPGQHGGDAWLQTVSAQLKYTLGQDVLRQLVDRHGIESIKGPAGTTLLFDPAVVHGSPGNLSPYDRRLLIMSYNRSDNPLADVANPRPEFIAARDFTPLRRLDRDEVPNHPLGAPPAAVTEPGR
ncbi:phytanoyl-CoA dioxygenase family protein [Actinoplanes derwentensis]|uniref:Ectoine hydroxylase n=1 Tax=Actinoplanes derwentensis TaxID=113562 RepID=A0A1H2DD30_9ACTN|nr:phytanoyl-CoA dioxygenase family protein [Actinoplanes derwentensis]GID89552.1 L-proline 4-hydroxylase [Actinoplanes derwentensis]SDT80499.1 ectoine hydroxylase [Actinoplanes derwentensis]